MKTITLVALGTLLLAPAAFAQTHLPTGSDAAGGFGVGTTASPGGLVVTGQTGNSATPGISVSGDGGVVWTGTYGTGLIPATGAGTRLMWYSKKAALRAGTAVGTNWDDSNIGNYSVVFGDGKASGNYSFAFGTRNISTGQNSMTVGYETTGTGFYSFAGGSMSQSAGPYSFTYGAVAYAQGYASAALNHLTGAFGKYSVAMNYGTVTSGDSSVAAGEKTTAASYDSFVIGRYNVIEGNGTTWVETDPLFVIGNGTGVTTDAANIKNRNALTVFKNGAVKITKRQGDIQMGEFGTPGSND